MADYIRPTPRNPILGLLADAMMGGLAYMEDPRRTQQMRGVGGLLSDTGIAQTVERLAYGEPLTKGKGFATRMKPETAAAAMTLAPEAVPIGRAAMAAARATKGLPVGNAIVYHGSPYRFDRFDPTKIGSGEGAQAYGYGHYVAQAEDVAKGYQKATSKDKFISGQGFFDPSQLEHLNVKAVTRRGDLDQAIAEARKYATPDSDYPETAAKAARDLARLEALKASGGMRPNEGAFYTIDLPDPAIARMLDWDKPLSQQPDIVKSINPQSLGLTYKQLENGNHAFVNSEGKIIGNLQKGGTQESFTKNWTEDVLRGTGSDLYRQLGQGMEGGPKVSSALREAGIPGIRYLDQGSRSNFRVQNTYKGQPYGEPVSFMTEQQAKDYAAEQIAKGFGADLKPGTSNFVVFPGEEDLLRILSVNGGLLSP